MCKSWVFTTILLLTVITATTGQYFDILQGLQQFFQPYPQGNPTATTYNGYSKNTSNRPAKQDKKKTNEQQIQNGRQSKKPSTSNTEYVFLTTTEKSSRKTTKSNSSQTINSSRSNKNQFSNILFGDFNTNFELTTKTNKRNRVRTTTSRNIFTTSTERSYVNNIKRPTTVGVANVNNYKRPTTDNIVFENNNFANTYYQNPTVSNQNQNRRPANTESSYINNYSPPNRETPQNSIYNNPGVINNNNFQRPQTNNPTYTANNRPTNNIGTNFGLTNPGYTTNNQNFGNFNSGNNRVTTNRFIPNQYDKVTNNYGTTGTNNGNIWGNNNRGNTANVNNRDGNFGINSWGNTDFDPESEYPVNTGFSLTNHPGVQPAPVNPGLPPITNKPVTSKNPYYNSYSSTEDSDEPEILIGPNEDDMTNREKRGYVALAEKMCDRYKALNVKKVVALPLLPSPDPVEVNVTSCTPVNVPLIIGGKVVSIRDFPHMALVGWKKIRDTGYSWKCGGSLISDQYILTAGHCTYQDKESDVTSGPPQAVQLGSTYLDDPGALVVKVTAVIRHPKYKMRRSYHDVALIKLRNKVTFSEVIRPACIGTPPPEGHNIIATGWGRTEFGGDHSMELRSVSLPIWNMEDCREIWGTSLKLPVGPTPESHVCAGVKKGGRDTCQGDSGGPAQVQDGCAWRVVGVTSYGRGCAAPATPALYATVPAAFVAAQAYADYNT